ncbi:MAG: SprT protein [Paraglaciecola sp.]
MLTFTEQKIQARLAVEQQVERCFEQAETALQKRFERPRVYFTQRGKIAGCARLQSNELTFNPVLLSDNLQTFLVEVVPHEICHLLAFRLYGKVKPHGLEWKTLMCNLFNLPGSAYHAMDISKVTGQTFTYFCSCGPVELSIRRHNKVIRHQQGYICRNCQQPLQRS